MNNLAPMRNCPGGCKVGYIGYRGMREFGKWEIWTLPNTVGWVSQYKLGLILTILSNANLHQHFKVDAFKF